MDTFGLSLSDKVNKMSDISSKGRFESQEQRMTDAEGNSIANEDLLMEQILENINTTPIGQVLKNIALLPEVRKEKILNVRKQLTNGNYDLNDRLNVALDKVLEDLIA